MPAISLEGKTAIITGASTGLGPVMAKMFVDQGAKVLLTARREELVAEAAAACGENAVAMRVSRAILSRGSIRTPHFDYRNGAPEERPPASA